MNKILLGVAIGYIFSDAIDKLVDAVTGADAVETKDDNVQYHNYSSATRPSGEEQEPPEGA